MKKVLLAGFVLLTVAACGYAPSAGLNTQGEEALQAQRMGVNECRMRLRGETQLFDQTDRNKDRFISRDEARTTVFANRNFSSYDLNGDDRVSLTEFMRPAEEAICGWESDR